MRKMHSSMIYSRKEISQSINFNFFPQVLISLVVDFAVASEHEILEDLLTWNWYVADSKNGKRFRIHSQRMTETPYFFTSYLTISEIDHYGYDLRTHYCLYS